jgi:hypothetical protein
MAARAIAPGKAMKGLGAQRDNRLADRAAARGRISKCGDGLARTLMYEAAVVILTRVKRVSRLKDWALAIARTYRNTLTELLSRHSAGPDFAFALRRIRWYARCFIMIVKLPQVAR